jgi:hypothetical protein
MPHFQSYTVDKNETLFSISCKLHINNPEELKRFHNLHCDHNKIIKEDLVADQVLLIPFANHELRKIENYKGDYHNFFKNQKDIIDFKNQLFIYNPTMEPVNYIVKSQVIDGFQDEDEYFECEFTLRKISESKGKFIIEVNQKNVLVNHKDLESKIEILAKKCSDCLFPMQISVNKNGVFEALHNFDDLKKRWEESKPELEEYFAGFIFEEYIKKMDYQMRNIETVTKSLKNNIFMQLLFFPLYDLKYSDDLKQHQHIKIALVNGSPGIQFDIENSIKKELANIGEIKILQNGKSIDKRTLEDVLSKAALFEATLNEKKPIEITYFGAFDLEKDTKLISKYKGEFILFFADNKEITKIIIERKL